ncbi:putative extracellular nuclease [Ilumatobacter fluminis]|uniref:Putative extracellular nuclease n=1 Tax=Ilumatobacter fluminis TaxID=467091 RepID=A0A4R7I0K3_9ACTN|nr:ExeM/NucH family extracellular endonuclease [Ilumatobacter fluminis]TDT16604.1 putative extracellular nuclease [Ilumatobacter fluminis]
MRLAARLGSAAAALGLLASGIVLTSSPAAAVVAVPDVVINEIRIDQSGDDDDEYVELAGTADTSLDGYTYLVIGDGAGGSGTIENVTALDGNSLGTDGLFVAAESTFSLATADATVDLNFENSDNVTHLLVTGFSGADGDDLDTNDDGTFDSTPWTAIVDSVALSENVPAEDLVYSTTIVGPDGTFVPGHTYRCGGVWEIGAFTPVGTDDTPGAANDCDLPSPADLLLTEIVVTPTEGEMIEIFNAGSGSVDLSDVYLTDATFAGGGTYYYNIVTGSNAGGGGFSDFHARFPDGAMIAAGEYQTVAMTGSADFLATYGVAPTYELFEDDAAADAVPDMREATAGSINDQGGLTNGGEVVVLYTWDGASDLVQDIDYAIWGDTAEAVDKTGVSIDGPDADTDTSTYLADTALASQALIADGPHATGVTWQRDDLSEGTETQTGGNGAAGSDEMSENLATTWCTGDPTPNAATACAVVPSSVVINEIHADPEATILGDANGDGVRSSDNDEFVEIVNTGTEPVDISGWTISDAVGVRHTFGAGTTLPADCAAVVFGGGTPTGPFGGSLVQTASSGTIGLNNGGDSVTLNDSSSGLVATVAYGAEGGNDESLTRDPDLTGAFVGHATATGSGGALFSPGTSIDGAAFGTDCVPEVAEVFIHEVQGSGPSVAITAPVIVEGIVTGLIEDDDVVEGFFVQEEDADADADSATSEGIYVFCNIYCPDPLAVGDLVSVNGTPEEFFGMSQLDAVDAGDVSIVSSGNPLPTAAAVTLPAAGSYLDEATFESLEGMLVTYPDTLAVSEYFQLGRFGQLVLTADARPFQFTHDNPPDVAEYAAFQDSLATRRVILDDDNNDQNDIIVGPDADEPYAYPQGGLSTTNRFRGGETITGLTGVMHWSFPGSGDNTWRLRPVDGVDYSFTPANPRTATPDDVGGDVIVASFNVLNYFANVDAGSDICGPSANMECRGADSEAERVRQLDKIAAAMAEMDADVIGIIEVENDTGAATQQIVDAVNAIVGAGTYDFVDTGFIGTDAIKVGLIYRTTTMTPTGDYAILDSSVDPDFIDDKNRPALIQTFTQTSTGEAFTVAVNHLKSKGSACAGDPDLGDGQGNCNVTRTDAALALADYLATDPTDSGDPDVLIIGDLNAYAKEDPITGLANAGYTNLLEAEFGSDIYSYVFDGQLGYLDHALANNSLRPSVTGATVWNINADEPVEFDYNDAVLDGSEQSFERESSALTTYAADPYRSSDHDPVLVGLALTDPPTVDLALDAGQDDPTNKSPIVLTASFDQEVTGLDSDDVVLGGAAAPSTAAVTDLGGGDFEIAVSGMTGSGDVVVSIRDEAAENAGGQASGASNEVSVDYDITPPTLTVPDGVSAPADDGEAGATVTFVVTADDPEIPTGALTEAMLDSSAIVCSPASGSVFPIGDTTVECTATDAAGNVAADSFIVTVVDDQDPVITEPAEPTVVVESDGPTTVEYDLPAVSDNSDDVEIVCDPASGSTFPVGTTTVTCTATDGSGNTTTTTFDIVVQSNSVTPTTTVPVPSTVAPELPATGSSPHTAVRWAMVLLAAGAALVLVTVRRRTSTTA